MHIKPSQTPGVRLVATSSGMLPVTVPNSVMDGDGFYVSHNDRDYASYGCETTALVVGQMEKFYILKGDHRTAYAVLIGQGFEACLDYFKSQPDLKHTYSDTPPA